MSADADLVGLGMTAMSLRPGATPLELAVKASAAALSDAGIGRTDVQSLRSTHRYRKLEIVSGPVNTAEHDQNAYRSPRPARA